MALDALFYAATGTVRIPVIFCRESLPLFTNFKCSIGKRHIAGVTQQYPAGKCLIFEHAQIFRSLFFGNFKTVYLEKTGPESYSAKRMFCRSRQITAAGRMDTYSGEKKVADARIILQISVGIQRNTPFDIFRNEIGEVDIFNQGTFVNFSFAAEKGFSAAADDIQCGFSLFDDDVIKKNIAQRCISHKSDTDGTACCTENTVGDRNV